MSPDLVAGTIEVSDGNLTLTVSFAPGTLSQTQTQFFAYLDTDEDPTTGESVPNRIGADYVIDAVVPRNSNRALIRDGRRGQSVGTTSVTFPTADQARITVPLALLGNDDGRLTFEVIATQYLSDTATTGPLDWMPNLGLPPGVVR